MATNTLIRRNPKTGSVKSTPTKTSGVATTPNVPKSTGTAKSSGTPITYRDASGKLVQGFESSAPTHGSHALGEDTLTTPNVPQDPQLPNQINTKQPTPGQTPVGSSVNKMPEGDVIGAPGQQQWQMQGGTYKPYQQAHADVVKSGAVSPQSQGLANVGQYLPDNQPDVPQAVKDFGLNNPYSQEAIKSVMDILNPQTTRDEIAKQTKVVNKENKEAAGIKTELMNIKRVMAGSEQDLRDEVTKAGGFATDSQIRALTVSRNDTLVKQASQLTDQLAIIQDAIASDTSLLGDMKQQANQQFTQSMQIMNFIQENQKNSLSAAKESITALTKSPGSMSFYLEHPDQASYADRLMGWLPGTTLAMASTKDLSHMQLSDGRDVMVDSQGNIVKTVGGARSTSGGGGGGTPTGTFTKTQLNVGAANAGVDLDTFNKYDYVTQNTFVNKGSDIKGYIKDTQASIDDGTWTFAAAKQDINSSQQPQEVKNYIIGRLKEKEGSQSTGTNWWSKVKSVLGF